MLLAAALSLSISLGAPPTAAVFWPPRLTPVTDKLKCDYATVLTVSAEKGQFQATTPAGVVTYRAGAEAQVIDREGKPLGAVGRLTVGSKVRIYYLADDGARVLEVDLE